MTYPNPDALVSTEWLAAHLSAPDVRVVDASWHMPASGRNGREEYDAGHIPGAIFFDIDEIADTSVPLPHMLPPPEKFASKVRKLGLGNGHKVVVYDSAGLGAARVWWMFRVFGHRDVAVLDGGLTKWKQEQRPLEDLPPMPRDRHFLPQFHASLVRGFEQMRANVDSKREQVIDARSAGRFAATAPEPRPARLAGHMPGAVNVPFTDLMNESDKTMKPAAELKARFDAAGVDFARPLVATCGSGMTACNLALALYLLGQAEVAVYDGSWAEWGDHPDAIAVAG